MTGADDEGKFFIGRGGPTEKNLPDTELVLNGFIIRARE